MHVMDNYVVHSVIYECVELVLNEENIDVNVHLPHDKVGERIMFLGWHIHLLVRSFVHSSGQILLPQYLMNGLNSFDKIDR